MTKSVLIIDDKPDDLHAMEVILKKEGCNVVTAASGENAFECLNKNKFDLVLVDIIMPKLSGYEVVKHIREKFKKSIKIICMSIVPLQDILIKDMEGFIQKPFSPEPFIKEVNRVLGENPGKQEKTRNQPKKIKRQKQAKKKKKR
jgi:DNA-binding NtrC family response regulator